MPPSESVDPAAAVRGAELADEFTSSLGFDRRLYKEELAVSVAHVLTLAHGGIISKSDADTIIRGLRVIREDIETGKFQWRSDLEDIHMNIEAALHIIIGDTAGKMHTARSRNDQTVTATRLFVKGAAAQILLRVRGVQRALLNLAESYKSAVMPGYTHLQRAQPVYFAHHMLAYFEMFHRDAERFASVCKDADELPLGSGALAGVPYPLNRRFTAKLLGFGDVTRNSLDAVADRDYICSFIHAASMCMLHLSRMAEEIVLWSADEFSFIRLSDAYTTGSSIMPQKRNPDFAELVRGKTGRTIGALVSIHTVLKGLPLAYNRDLQEDKPPLFDAADTVRASLSAAEGMLEGMAVIEDNMLRAAEQSHAVATDMADYLVRKGLPFRQAYIIVSDISRTARNMGKTLLDLSLDEYKAASELFEADVFDLTCTASADSRNVEGGTAYTEVLRQLQAAYGRLHAASLNAPNPPDNDLWLKAASR